MDLAASFQSYVDEMLTTMHGSGLPEDDRIEMRTELLEKLNKWIIVKLLTELATISPSEVPAFQKYIEEYHPSPDDLRTYISQRIPNGETFLTQCLLEFRGLYLGTT